MTTLALTAPTHTRLLWSLTIAATVLFVLSMIWAGFDARTLDEGTAVWLKPAKFAASFVVLFATLAWVETRLSRSWRDGRLLRWTVVAMGGAFIVEMGYMVFQAAQAEASHFNVSSAFTSFMYSVMGFGAVVLVAGVAIFGFAAARDRQADLGPALRRGVSYGFIASFALTLVVAGYMSSQGGHFVGTPGAGAATLPIFGWSAAVGDLRPAHFLSLHAMQIMPLLGWILDRQGIARASILMALGALGYTVLTLAVFAQALAGYPLIAL